MTRAEKEEALRLTAAPRARGVPPCKGYGWHVFTLGAARCSLCGWVR